MVTLPEKRKGKYVLLENSVDLNNICIDVCTCMYIYREREIEIHRERVIKRSIKMNWLSQFF